MEKLVKKLMRKVRTCFELNALFIALVVGTNHVSAEPVHISVNEDGGLTNGAGYSVSKGQECFVITPYHVVEFAPSDGIQATDRTGRTGAAILVKELAIKDVALLKMKDNDAIRCGDKWRAPSGVEDALDEADFVQSVKQDNRGRRTKNRFFVSSFSSEELLLSPFGHQDQIRRGDSGSTLYAGKIVVGMLLSVDPGDGSGKAIPQGHLHALLADDLSEDLKTVLAIAPVTQNRRENPYATMSVRQLFDNSAHVELMDVTLDPRTGEPNVPDSAQYLVTAQIIDLAYERITNKNYKAEVKRENSFFKQLGDSLSGRNESERYFTKYMIDVEVVIYDTKSSSVVRNILQQPVTINTSRSNQTDKDATSKGVKDAVEEAISGSNYAHWLQRGKSTNQPITVKSWFKSLTKKK